MTTSKFKMRPHAVDFSEATAGRITDSSFAVSCDVNAIVKHYDATGVDPFVERIKTARYETAQTKTFDEAMRIVAELDSAFQEQPASVRAAHANASKWAEAVLEANTPQEALEEPLDPPAEPAPQDSSEDNSE